MTKKELAQYKSICDEILELETSIKKNTEHSTVRGSDAEFPYLSHPIQVSGVQSTTDNKNLMIRVNRLKAKKRTIERFVDNINDSLTRRIFRMRFLEGKNWVQVAIKIGGGNTEKSVQMIVKRFLDKCKRGA